MKVSVLIPLYNQQDYIEECLLSVLNQTYENLEIIIIDDGSTDGSYEIVEKHLTNKRIKLKKQKNVGLGATRNRLIIEATGDYIFHLDADDYITENCVETLLSIQDKNNSDIVFSNFMSVDDNKKILKKIERVQLKKREDYIRYFLSGFGYNSVCNTLIRRDLYLKNNISVPDLNYGEDWSVIYQLIYYSKNINNSDKYTYYYRKNNAGMTYTKMTDCQILKNIDDIIVGKDKFIEDNS